MSASSVEAKRVPPLSSNAVIVKLLNTVQRNVNRNTGDNIRHGQSISSLEERKCREERENTGVFVTQLSPQEHAQVVCLVGRKCIVKCLLNGLETDSLWDTGLGRKC